MSRSNTTNDKASAESSESDFNPSDDDESAVNDLVNTRASKASSSSYRPTRRRSIGASGVSGKKSEKISQSTTSNRKRRAPIIIPDDEEDEDEDETYSEGTQRESKSTAINTSQPVKPIAAFVGPAHKPDILCAFCQGTAQENYKTLLAEILISCVECGSSGHPSCMRWGKNLRKVAVAQQYPWRCMECKTCEICCDKGDDSKIMFCDRCDRGWHLYCLDPPLEKPPRGLWHCPSCKVLEGHVREQLQSTQQGKPRKGGHYHRPSISSPLSSTFGPWEAGPSCGSASIDGKTNGTTSQFKGPMKASGPYPIDLTNDADLTSQSASTSLMGPGRRIRKPTDPDRSYQFSKSPHDSHTSSTASHSRSNSSAGMTGLHRGNDVNSSQKKGKGKQHPHLQQQPQQQQPTSIILRLKRQSKPEIKSDKRNGQRYTARKARPTSLRLPDVNIDDDSDEDSSSSAVPTPRALSVSDEEDEEEEEEPQDPFGGILSPNEADTSKTAPSAEDKERFERSKSTAETKLGSTTMPVAVGSASGRTIKKPLSALLESTLISTLSSSNKPLSASSYFTGSPWAGTGAGGEKARQLAKGSGLATASSQSTEASTIPGTPVAESSVATSAESGQAMPIKMIRFGGFDIDTWFQAPYPEEYSLVPDGRLWMCEHCLKYMKSRFMATRHRLKCKMRHPPGAEIYRDGNVSVFEVDGRKNKIYCQNLCLLAKMFLDHKTLYYDVEPFLFYIVAEVDEGGAHFVGYFSKEKRSPLNYNVSCIMTLPIRQRRGWGNFIIDISYLLSKKEGRLGSPEKPLSDLGLLSYRNYWTLAVFYFLRTCPDQVSLQDISNATSMTVEDVFYVLRAQDMITLHDGVSGGRAPATSKFKSREGAVSMSGTSSPSIIRPARNVRPTKAEREKENENAVTIPSNYSIHFDRDYVFAHIKNYEAKGYLRVKPERLHWTPFLVVRSLTQEGLSGQAIEASPAEPPPLYTMAPREDQSLAEATEDANNVAANPVPNTEVAVETTVDDDEEDDDDLFGPSSSDAPEAESEATPEQIMLDEPGQPRVIIPGSLQLNTVEQVPTMDDVIELVKSTPKKRSLSPISLITPSPVRKTKRHKGKTQYKSLGSTRGLHPVVEITSRSPLTTTRRRVASNNNDVRSFENTTAYGATAEEQSMYSDEDAPGSDDPMIIA